MTGGAPGGVGSDSLALCQPGRTLKRTVSAFILFHVPTTTNFITRAHVTPHDSPGAMRPRHLPSSPWYTVEMLIPDPMTLIRQPAPFDDPEWIYEIKHDGFRALAVIEA